MKIWIVAGTSLGVLLTVAADAGTLSGTGWTPTGCGQEPAAIKIDTTSEKAFTASLNDEDKFQAAENTYSNCVVKEAQTDSASITTSAQAVRDHGEQMNHALEADVDTGLAKFGKKK